MPRRPEKGRKRSSPRRARLVALAEPGLEERERTRLARRLRQRLAAPVTLQVTDNTYTMIPFSRRLGAYRVRLHHMFLDAPDGVVQQLAGYLRGHDKVASAVLDDFIHENRRLIRHVSPAQRQRRLPLATAGRYHDLGQLLVEVQREYRRLMGDEARDVAIAWAPAPKVSIPRRSIKLGSYSADTQIIRIHPALDQAIVPTYFIRWIIFHELLHHRFRADLKARNGRVHTPEFCRLERAFPFFHDARVWEHDHLDLLLWWYPTPALGELRAG